MTAPSARPSGPIEIRKYSNRRFYDSTRSRHLTLEEMRNLIREGHDVRVTDNKSGADITAKVLTQIILDLESPKLDLFPATMLAQIIRVNDHLLKGFYERFFQQFFGAFSDYQRMVETKLKDSSMLPAGVPPLTAWAQPWLNPWGLPSQTSAGAGGTSAAEPARSGDLAATVASLQSQISNLQARLVQSGKTTMPPSRRRRGRKQGKEPLK
jgi:polyhydroxyalkanoate synthesis repressor PhaR